MMDPHDVEELESMAERAQSDLIRGLRSLDSLKHQIGAGREIEALKDHVNGVISLVRQSIEKKKLERIESL